MLVGGGLGILYTSTKRPNEEVDRVMKIEKKDSIREKMDVELKWLKFAFINEHQAFGSAGKADGWKLKNLGKVMKLVMLKWIRWRIFFFYLSFWGYVVRRWKNCVWTTLGTIRDYYWKLSEYMAQVAMANGYLHMDSVLTVWRSWDWLKFLSATDWSQRLELKFDE